MGSKYCCILLYFLLVGCSFNRPYYIVNETEDSLKLELTLNSLSNTTRLSLIFMEGVGRTKEFVVNKGVNLDLSVLNDSVVLVEIPPKGIMLLTSIVSPSYPNVGETSYVVMYHRFVQGNKIEIYSKVSFLKGLVRKSWFDFLGSKSYFVYN